MDEETDVSCDELYSVGDFLDALHPDIGGWFEAKVQKITILLSLSSHHSSPHFTRRLDVSDSRDSDDACATSTRILHSSRNASSSHESHRDINTLTPSACDSSSSCNIPCNIPCCEARTFLTQDLFFSQNDKSTTGRSDEKWIRDLYFQAKVSDPSSCISESKEKGLNEDVVVDEMNHKDEQQERRKQQNEHQEKCEEEKMMGIKDVMKDLRDQGILDAKSTTAKSRYYIKFLKESLSSEGVIVRDVSQVRPLSRRILAFNEVSVGSLVLVNYNLNEDKKARGYWYDCFITKKDAKRKRLHGTIFTTTTTQDDQSVDEAQNPCIGSQVSLPCSRKEASTSPAIKSGKEDDQTITSERESGLQEDEEVVLQGRTCIRDQRIWFIREVYLIEKNVPRRQEAEEEVPTEAGAVGSPNQIMSIKHGPPDKLRPTPFDCESCQDDLQVDCRDCSCIVCGKKNHPDKQIICDDCDRLYHLWCILPLPLKEVPGDEEQWFCPDCTNNDAKLIKHKESRHLFNNERVTTISARQVKKQDNKESKMTKSCRDKNRGTAKNKSRTEKKTQMSVTQAKRKQQKDETMTTGHSLSCITKKEKLEHHVDRRQQTPGEEPSGEQDHTNYKRQRRREASGQRDRNSSDQEFQSYKKTWGHGMACVGRRFTSPSDVCSSTTFFGPIPGIEVGSTWRYRFQVSEVGLHAPLVSGVSGREAIGASSLVFSCMDCDDIDLGDEIYFTGSGGFDLDKNTSRTILGKNQVRDQTLTRSNKALAMSCAAQLNSSLGGFTEGCDWKLGKPIRVLRSGNSRGCHKRSRFLPKIGIRYDGIYKVVKYWPEKRRTRKSCRNDVKETNDAQDEEGVIVWRFLLRRDDPTPSPWTKEGKNRIRRLQLDHLIQAKTTTMKTEIMTSSISITSSTHPSDNGIESSPSILKCVICLEFIVDDSVTTVCQHTFCRDCLRKCFNSNGNRCPICRRNLPKLLPK